MCQLGIVGCDERPRRPSAKAYNVSGDSVALVGSAAMATSVPSKLTETESTRSGPSIFCTITGLSGSDRSTTERVRPMGRSLIFASGLPAGRGPSRSPARA